ncbi:InlB B-repeat-containing protein, partial [Bifidobacterium sp. UTBIF-78]|uniref:InlB B-repeat-containing protein n=1 Tax=Bifidobacterium sp. UTBIF-78 TaxID=1465263 RepID=UPI0015E2D5D3
MTGNNKVWRAPLAGLASVAMIATMGVAAATANATGFEDPVNTDDNSFSVAVYRKDTPYQPYWTSKNAFGDGHYRYGDTFVLDGSNGLANPYADSLTDHKIFSGYSYDLAGTQKVSSKGFAVKGDTKLYAQYAEANTVTFKRSDGVQLGQIEVKQNEPISAEAYAKAFPAEPKAPTKGYVFAGWTYTNSTTKQDLYTNQAITSDITLYPYFVKAVAPQDEENLAAVKFHKNGTSEELTKYTLAGRPFPAFRAPESLKQDQWQAPLGTEYDFTKNVANSTVDYEQIDADQDGTLDAYVPKADFTVYGVKFADADAKAWTITYKFGANPTNDGVQGAAHSYYTEQVPGDKPVEQPSDPAKKNAEFIGWFSEKGEKVDFSKNVADLPGANANDRTVTVEAGWDTKNIVPVVFYYNYQSSQVTWAFPKNAAVDANNKVKAFTGKALNYQTANTAIVPPTGLEDYYQTAADADPANNTYTTRTVTGWYAITDDAPVDTVPASISVYAKWSNSIALQLNANGGFFKNGTNYAYATKADGQKWQDVIETPTRDGFDFNGWVAADDESLTANLSDGYYYKYNGTVKTEHELGNYGSGVLKAMWTPSEKNDNAAALSTYPLNGANEYNGWSPDFLNKKADYALWAKYAKSEAGWKSYVDYVYSLKDEYVAYRNLSGQARIDAGVKLAAKL